MMILAHPKRLVPIATVALCALLAGAAWAQEEIEEQEEPGKQEEAGKGDEGTWAEVREAYAKAKRKAMEMGESVPDRVPDWVVEDLKNVGDWEYRVVEAQRDELEATLNDLGAERWECFAVEGGGKKVQLVFKRRKRSRLRELQDLSPDDLLTVIKLIRDRRLDEE